MQPLSTLMKLHAWQFWVSCDVNRTEPARTLIHTPVTDVRTLNHHVTSVWFCLVVWLTCLWFIVLWLCQVRLPESDLYRVQCCVWPIPSGWLTVPGSCLPLMAGSPFSTFPSLQPRCRAAVLLCRSKSRTFLWHHVRTRPSPESLLGLRKVVFRYISLARKGLGSVTVWDHAAPFWLARMAGPTCGPLLPCSKTQKKAPWSKRPQPCRTAVGWSPRGSHEIPFAGEGHHLNRPIASRPRTPGPARFRVAQAIAALGAYWLLMRHHRTRMNHISRLAMITRGRLPTSPWRMPSSIGAYARLPFSPGFHVSTLWIKKLISTSLN